MACPRRGPETVSRGVDHEIAEIPERHGKTNAHECDVDQVLRGAQDDPRGQGEVHQDRQEGDIGVHCFEIRDHLKNPRRSYKPMEPSDGWPLKEELIDWDRENQANVLSPNSQITLKCYRYPE